MNLTDVFFKDTLYLRSPTHGYEATCEGCYRRLRKKLMGGALPLSHYLPNLPPPPASPPAQAEFFDLSQSDRTRQRPLSAQADSLIGNARAVNTSISGRGAERYIRFDPWSWLSLQRAQA